MGGVTTIRLPSDDIDWSTAGSAVIFDTSSQSPEFDEGVTAMVVQVLRHLRHLQVAHERDLSTTRRVVLWSMPDAENPAIDQALHQALRAIAGTLTLDSAGAGLRINVLRATSPDAATLRFLASPGSDFVAGATLDLTDGFVP